MGIDSEHDIRIWKLRRLIKELDAARGGGTSMISLIIPARAQVSRVTGMLREEHGAAGNIKSQVNRVSVQAAITSAIHRLTLYNRVLPNGLLLFVGTVLTDEGKEKRIVYDFEPPKPMHRFHTDALSELLDTDTKYGFIIIDGNGCLYGSLSGNNREVLHKFSVDLPRKHGRGGQSSQRFSRLRDEKRHNYVRKVAEMAVQYFISGDGSVNVAGIVLAGSADFKIELRQSSLFDQRLTSKVIKVVDVSYGGDSGFNQGRLILNSLKDSVLVLIRFYWQAIDLSADALDSVKLVREKQLIQRYFDEISQDTGQFCFGAEDTLHALELGAVETLIVWEDLSIPSPFHRDEQDQSDKDRDIIAVNKPGALGVESMIEQQSLLEWFVENHQRFGARLEIVSDRSQEGAQLVKGFGGLGALLRYKVEFVGTVDDCDDEFYDDETV